MIPELTTEQFEALRPYEYLLAKIREGKYLTKREQNYPEVFSIVYNEISIKENGKPFRETKSGCRSCNRFTYATRLARYYFNYKVKNKIMD